VSAAVVLLEQYRKQLQELIDLGEGAHLVALNLNVWRVLEEIDQALKLLKQKTSN